MSKIKLKRGDDETLLVEIVEEQADGTLLPFDLSHTARADLHAKANGETVLQLSTENGSIGWQVDATTCSFKGQARSVRSTLEPMEPRSMLCRWKPPQPKLPDNMLHFFHTICPLVSRGQVVVK